MVTYQKKGVCLEIRYTVEYIDNKKDWEYVCSGSIKHGEPWERYKKKRYSSLDEAMTQYLIRFFDMCSTNVVALFKNGIEIKLLYTKKDDQIGTFDVRLFEEVLLDGETIRESYIEPESTILHGLRTTFGREQVDELDKLRRLNDEQSDLLVRYAAFTKKYNAEDLFKKFQQNG